MCDDSSLTLRHSPLSPQTPTCSSISTHLVDRRFGFSALTD